MNNIPAPTDLAAMAWEIQALFDALDELMPLDSADNPPALHGLASVGRARAQELANHLSKVEGFTNA
ncbi:hypothetical protein RAS12_12025 [Achromobacter seleniivolatilans]|uniref:Uncharacterized protein n=1 Tax=Achromobacter seleniivolatilans TaxID=3047478 RepID=A0ABY9M896_9BURK|nr:hypothetical protein [Achromobacter sp. R39]WMD23065.1 hypothetical protein RAS12_12025 [Achromobacter sp. R39]